MKMRCLILTAAVLFISSAGFSQGKAVSIEQLSTKVAKAFKAKRLGTLDEGKPYAGRVRFVVEHSLNDRNDTKTFSSMKHAGAWLFRGRREAGINAGSLDRCSKGVCTFNINGLLHNNLYLKKITYGFLNGKPFVKAVHFVDGD